MEAMKPFFQIKGKGDTFQNDKNDIMNCFQQNCKPPAVKNSQQTSPIFIMKIKQNCHLIKGNNYLTNQNDTVHYFLIAHLCCFHSCNISIIFFKNMIYT